MRAVAFLLSSVTACKGSGSARWMGTEEPGLWHSTGKRKEGAFSWIQLVSSFGSYCVLWGKFGLLWSKETPGLLSWQGRGAGDWLWGSGLSLTPRARCHTAGRAFGHSQAPWLTAPLKGVVLEHGGHKSQAIGGHKSHCTFQDQWVTLLVDLGRCPQEASSGCRAFPTWHTCGAASPELIPMTLFMKLPVPQPQGDTQWIFSFKEIPWTICLSHFLGRISAQAFLKACVIFRIFPCPTGVSHSHRPVSPGHLLSPH